MKVRVTDAGGLAAAAAAVIADHTRRAVAERGACTVAFSGGSTPARMLAELAELPLPWAHVHVFQVDERAVPEGHPARNLAMLRAQLVDRVPLPASNLHPMPVGASDLDGAAMAYGTTLRAVCGDPAVLDLVHLGLGADGHTASLMPGDPVLEVTDRDAAATGAAAGYRRLTLTYPALDRARRILWLVAGADKAAALSRLTTGDTTIPAGRVRRSRATVLSDVAPGPGGVPPL